MLRGSNSKRKEIDEEDIGGDDDDAKLGERPANETHKSKRATSSKEEMSDSEYSSDDITQDHYQYLMTIRNKLDEESFKSKDWNYKAILIDENKVGRYKKKMHLASCASGKSTYFNLANVKALQIVLVAITIALRMTLPIKYCCHHDQSWMFNETAEKYTYVPQELQNASGQQKTQGGRQGFTHSATVLYEYETGKIKVGPGAIIIASNTKDGGKSLSGRRKKQMEDVGCTLNVGHNWNIGEYGLSLWVSENGWQKEYHTKENVELLSSQ